MKTLLLAICIIAPMGCATNKIKTSATSNIQSKRSLDKSRTPSSKLTPTKESREYSNKVRDTVARSPEMKDCYDKALHKNPKTGRLYVQVAMYIVGDLREVKDSFLEGDIVDSFFENSFLPIDKETKACMKRALTGLRIPSKRDLWVQLIFGVNFGLGEGEFPSYNSLSLRKEQIRPVIRAVGPEIKLCYKKELEKNNSLTGEMKIRFRILASGTVAEAEAIESIDDVLDTCVIDIVNGLVFPKPVLKHPKKRRGFGSRYLVVKYPFNFTQK